MRASLQMEMASISRLRLWRSLGDRLDRRGSRGWLTILRRTRTRAALRPTDVFLVGHPKSGNTLAAYALALIQSSHAMDNVTLANLARWVPTVHGRDWEVSQFSGLPSPRIFRNEWSVFPDLYPRTIYLLRDPRAVLVSYYHHYTRITGPNALTLKEFLEIYIRHGCIPTFEPKLVRWDLQVLYWLRRAKDNDVLLIKYEDLIGDRLAGIERLLAYVGLVPSGTVLEEVVNRTSFSHMQSLEDRFGAESFQGAPKGEASSSERFVRKGRTDAWREELTPGDETLLLSAFGEVMAEAGYATDSVAGKCKPQ